MYPGPGMAPPGDEVPNPMTMTGLIQQGVVRDNDMAQTVRESQEWTTEDGQVRKTLLMMDGGRHEIYEWNEYAPCVEDTYYDKNGKSGVQHDSPRTKPTTTAPSSRRSSSPTAPR